MSAPARWPTPCPSRSCDAFFHSEPGHSGSSRPGPLPHLLFFSFHWPSVLGDLSLTAPYRSLLPSRRRRYARGSLLRGSGRRVVDGGRWAAPRRTLRSGSAARLAHSAWPLGG